jgi:hypothetical protein
LGSRFALALTDGDHKDHYFLIEDLINQTITGAKQFELVAIR